MQRAAVFSCLGLGDGLISLVLSNNLHLNGACVTTFHPFLSSLQAWFPHLKIEPFPEKSTLKLEQFDKIFIILEKSPWMQEIVDLCLKNYRDKTTILNPIATPNQDYPYWEEGRFNGEKTFVDNLYTFSREILKFNVSTKSNGITLPEEIKHSRDKKRIVIHPTSSREGKNWAKKSYLLLAKQLEKKGYTIRFLLSKEERKGWDLDETAAPVFTHLQEIAAYIYQSSYLIGNDSGMGHLASCLGIPTLTICRSSAASQFWRPGWARGAVLYPSPWIPNLKGLRLRDRYWKRLISVNRVIKAFNTLQEQSRS